MLINELKFDPEEYVFPERHQKILDGMNLNDIEDITERFMAICQRRHILVKMTDGIYRHLYNGRIILPGYKTVDRYEVENEYGYKWMCPYPYGVCDNYQQVLERDIEVQQWIADPNKKFVILLTYVSKAEQPETQGWRWEKWGIT